MRLKKDARTGYYYAQFTTAEGDTKSLSTKTTNREDAVRVAKASNVKELELAAKAGRLTNEAVSRIVAGKRVTLTDALQAYSEWQATVGTAPRTILNYQEIISSWIEHAHIHHLAPIAVTEKHIHPWVNNQASERKANTRRVNLSVVSAFLDYCSIKGWLNGNPAKLCRVNLDHLSHEQKEKRPRAPFTEKDYQTISHWLAQELKTASAALESREAKGHGITEEMLNEVTALRFFNFAVRLAWETGLRLGDIAGLEWACFTDANEIVVWTGKRDKRVALPLPKHITDLLSQIPVASTKYLFPDYRALHLDNKKRASLSVRFSRLLVKAGVDGQDKSFHSLRHSFVTRMRTDEHMTWDAIALMVGHSHTGTTKGYAGEGK
jgi:integrase